MRPLRPKDLRTPPLPAGSAAATSAAERSDERSGGAKPSPTAAPSQSIRIASGLRSRLAGSILPGFGACPPPPDPETAAAAAKVDDAAAVAYAADPRTQSVRVTSGLRSRLAGSIFSGFGSAPPQSAKATPPSVGAVKVETVEEDDAEDDEDDDYVSLDELAKKEKRKKKVKVHREDLDGNGDVGGGLLGVLRRFAFGRKDRWSSWNPCLKAIEAVEKPA